MIVAGIATIPQRQEQVQKTIASLYYQVDKINLALNDYKEIPEWVTDIPKVEVWLTTGTDEQKLKQVEGEIYLSCDDDLIYPPDYVRTIQKGLQDHPGHIVTFHGRTFSHYPIKSYYRDYSSKYRCLDEVPYNVYVQVGGTGCMGFETKYFKVPEFRLKFMADIQLAVEANRQGVPVICLAHQAGWIRYNHVGETIYDRFKHSDSEQTNLYNSVAW